MWSGSRTDTAGYEMRRLALAVLLTAATAVLGDSPVTSQELVDRAKAAKAQRKASTTRVITNADVKKSKGKIAQTSVPATAVEAPPSETLTERHEAAKKASAAAQAKRASAEKNVADLEKAVAAIEQQYYEENDLDRRDGEIVQRFTAAKAKLDAARAELQAILDAVDPPAGPSASGQ